jgi:uncharacterized protein YdeI (YjbR/CyaY-like superfamily)
MGALDRAQLVQPSDRAAWRQWLEHNHATAEGVWLVTGRTGSSLPRLDYGESVEEALCFGWVDGQAGTIDEERSKLYFAPRKPGSPWAASNKERVARLMESGAMEPAGIAVIDRAKSDGSWSIFDSVDRFEEPPELKAALGSAANARENWNAWPKSVKRHFLAAIALALMFVGFAGAVWDLRKKQGSKRS